MRKMPCWAGLVLLLVGCQGGPVPEMGEPAAEALPLLVTSYRPAGGRLCRVRVFRHPRGQWLVSPSWNPDGRTLRVRGRYGRGDYLLRPAAGLLEPLVRQADKQAAALERSSAAPGRRLIVDREGLRIYFEPYRGRLLLERAERRVLLAADAWAPAPSPAGDKLAWCTGPLSDPELWLSVRGGAPRSLGPGAQPAWLDDEQVVYTVPRPAAAGAAGPLAGAELYLRRVSEPGPLQLTDTAASTEMNPAPGPGGRLAWSDWSDGSLAIGHLCGDAEVAP